MHACACVCKVDIIHTNSGQELRESTFCETVAPLLGRPLQRLRAFFRALGTTLRLQSGHNMIFLDFLENGLPLMPVSGTGPDPRGAQVELHSGLWMMVLPCVYEHSA